jgi:hypothetical protein
VFVLTYIVAVFMTIVNAEACNTTTISLFVTVTDLIPLENTSTVTVTQFGSAQDLTSTTLSADGTGTLTMTKVTTVTASSEVGSQAAAGKFILITLIDLNLTRLQSQTLARPVP